MHKRIFLLLVTFLLFTFGCKKDSNPLQADADTEKPSVAILYPINNSQIKSDTTITVKIDGVDNTGIRKLELFIDGDTVKTLTVAPYEFKWNTAGISGDHSIYAKAIDADGNVGQSGVVKVTIITVDTARPVVAVTYPLNNAQIKADTTVVIKMDCTDNIGVAKLDLYIDGTLLKTLTAAPYECAWNTSGKAGTHTIIAKATDASGNLGQSSAVNVTVVAAAPDTTKPAVAVAFPLNNSQIKSDTTVTLMINCTDNVGIAKVEIYLDGVLERTLSAAPYECLWNTAGEIANHTIFAKATDLSGNSAQSGSINFNVVAAGTMGTTPPAPKPLSPANGITGQEININCSWSGSIGATGYKLQVSTSNTFESSLVTETTLNAESTQLTWLKTNTVYYWRVCAMNAAGASGWSPIWQLQTGANDAPLLTAPSDGSAEQAISAILYWNSFPGALYYTLQVSTSESFSSYVYSQGGLTSLNAKIPGLVLGTTYYWRVRAENNSGTSVWSKVWRFQTIATVGIEMLAIQGGSFSMGDNFGDGKPGEKPVHTVTLSPFKMSKTVITRKEWSLITNDGERDNYPESGINWFQAVSYCNALSSVSGRTPCYSIGGNTKPSDWKTGIIECDFTANGYRLPTEAEWEYAAREAGTVIKYAGTNSASELGKYAWYVDNSGGVIHPVAGKLPNSLGLYDMCGNVWQWCWDWCDFYGSGVVTNPTGPVSGTTRILRGGSIFSNTSVCRTTYRSYINPSNVDNSNGFRVVLNN